LGDTVTISGAAREALAAWSARLGEAVTLTTPAGPSFRARLVQADASQATLLVYEQMSAPAESGLELILLQALPDKERMELIIEKATELGVDMIVPWKAEKGIGLTEREDRQAKAHRFTARARKAAKQCRRAKIPALMPFSDLAAALAYAGHAGLKIALWEHGGQPLKSVLAQAGPIASAAILIGPEGGLTPGEVEAARGAGFIAASLGARILRTETAAIAAAAIIQFVLGDLGSLEIP